MDHPEKNHPWNKDRAAYLLSYMYPDPDEEQY